MAADVTYSGTDGLPGPYTNWMLIASIHPSWLRRAIPYDYWESNRDRQLSDWLISCDQIWCAPTSSFVVGAEPIRYEVAAVVAWCWDGYPHIYAPQNLGQLPSAAICRGCIVCL